MAALELSGDQRWAIAEKLDLDPVTMTPEKINARLDEWHARAARKAERSFADATDLGAVRGMGRGKRKPAVSSGFLSGACRARTGDPQLAKLVLSQLS